MTPLIGRHVCCSSRRAMNQILPTMLRTSFLVTFCLAACGGDDPDPSVDASNSGAIDASGNNGVDASTGNVTCSVTATATANVNARTITGVGSVQCNGTASLSVETCVQWNPGGTFQDIMCLSETHSNVTQLEVDNLSSCGISTGRRFRTRVNAAVNGVDQPEELSADIGCE
jgi:hypothetical protein